MMHSYEMAPRYEQDGVVTTLETLRADTVLDTASKRKEFFGSLDFKDFIAFIDTISESIVFDVSEALSKDGGDVAVGYSRSDVVSPHKEERWPGYLAPRREEKEALLRTAFTVAQEQEDMESAATLLGLSIAMIHPYEDSNGRTGRVLYGLLTRGYDGGEADKDYYRLLSGHEGREVLNFSPEIANLPALFVSRELNKQGGWSSNLFFRAERPSNWKWHTQTIIGSCAVSNVLREAYFGLIPLFEGMEDVRSAEQYGRYTPINEQDHLVLNAGKVFPNPWKIDAKSLLQAQSERKTAYINAVINCFKSDQPNPLVDPSVLNDTYRPVTV